MYKVEVLYVNKKSQHHPYDPQVIFNRCSTASSIAMEKTAMMTMKAPRMLVQSGMSPNHVIWMM